MGEHASGGRSVVVAAAILDATGERVLAARRTRPADAAGRWELPGGKVEPGESPEAALVREIGEELGCVIAVGDWLPGETPIRDRHVLRVASARITAGEARPREHDGHDAVRWLAADELGDVDWLEPDRPFLPGLRELLVSTGGVRPQQIRGIFFGEDGAAAVVARLQEGGWEASAARERYHGEDDDEDHPWAVTTDAPELVLEVLVDEYDGWLDAPGDHEAGPDNPAGVAPEPLALPSEPRRIKRPGLGDGI